MAGGGEVNSRAYPFFSSFGSSRWIPPRGFCRRLADYLDSFSPPLTLLTATDRWFRELNGSLFLPKTFWQMPSCTSMRLLLKCLPQTLQLTSSSAACFLCIVTLVSNSSRFRLYSVACGKRSTRLDLLSPRSQPLTGSDATG